MKPPRNIRRVDLDAKRDHGWVVTLQRKGAIIVKRFSDGVYGGKRKALEAAVAYRDSFLARDRPVDHQIWIRTRLRKNNTSGIPGVGRYEVRDNPNSRSVRAFWLASWTDEHGASRKRKFSVAVYGEEEAKLLAIAERNYQLRRVCAINAAARHADPPDQEGIWNASGVVEGSDGEGNGKRTDREDRRRSSEERIQVVEATIDKRGKVKLLKPVELTSPRRAIVTIFAEGREHIPGSGLVS
ncbi:MAG: AP2/ERF family transcription factor [Thermodesulfobacteriota bacterium]